MNNQPENVNQPNEPQSWREERMERRQARREALGNQPGIGTVIAGLVLILIPVIILFDRALRFYRTAGNRLTSQAWGAGFFGIVLLVLTAVILFELDSEIWGPTIIILVGIGILAGAMLKSHKE
jgi:hypothetical protein